MTTPIPFSASFDRQQRVLLLRLMGRVDAQTLAAAHAAVRSVLEREGPCSCIFDFTTASVVELPSQLLDEIARSPRIIPPGNMRVLIASDPLAYGTLRQFSAYQSDQTGEYFLVRTLEEAMALFTGPLTFKPMEI
jgi:hypothetical protein